MTWDAEYTCTRCGHKADDSGDTDHTTWLCNWCREQPCDRCYKPLGEGEHGLGLCPLEARKRAPVIWADDIPGGVEITNGICNEDGTPKRYYSHSAIRAACKVKGVIPYHDVYAEGGNKTLEDARQYTDWLQTSTAKKQKQWRDEERRERGR